MILDAFTSFSYVSATQTTDSLAIAAGTQASNNVIDLHMAGIPVLVNNQGARDIGIGDDPALKLYCQVTTTFTSGGAATLVAALQGATDNGSGAPATFVTWWASPAYALATLNAGSQLFNMDMPRPPDGVAIPRFLRMLYTVGVATVTAGAVSSGIVLDRIDQPYSSTDNSVLGGYPPGITVAN